MHPNEHQTIEELSKIYHELIISESTDDNMAKIHALEAQMKRITSEIKAKELAPEPAKQ